MSKLSILHALSQICNRTEASIQNSPKSASKSLQAIDNKGDTRYGFVRGQDGLSC